MNTPIHDLESRKKAIDIKHSFVVQAPAGSGKTEILIQRFLNALSHCEQNPEEVLAITFTKKAASEMRHRILMAFQLAQKPDHEISAHQQLTKSLAVQVLNKSKILNWCILDNPARLQVKTIDSLCAQINRSSEQRLLKPHPSPTEVYRQVTRDFIIDETLSNQKSMFELLSHFHNNHSTVEALLMSCLAERDQWLPKLFAGNKDELSRANTTYLEALCTSIIAAFEAVMNKPIYQQLRDSIQFGLTNLMQQKNLNVHTQTQDRLNHYQSIANIILTKDLTLRKTVTAKQGFPAPSSVKSAQDKEFLKTAKQNMLAALKEIENDVELITALQQIYLCPDFSIPAHYQRLMENLNHLLPRLVAYLKFYFITHNTGDFIETSLNAIAAVDGMGNHLNQQGFNSIFKIKHLLIDEFQDTSYTQMSLLAALTQHWDQSEHRSLFLVGDPMQSIYKFRQAEVTLFYKAIHHGIGTLKLEFLQLTSNFRSSEQLIHWFNHTFAKIFPQHYQPSIAGIPYHASTAQCHFPGQVQTKWFIDDSLVSEAEYIVTEIKKIISHDRNSSIAILVRSRNVARPIIQTFKKHHLSFKDFGLDSLIQSEDVIDLLKIFDFLQAPNNDRVLATLLCSRLIGFKPQDIYNLKHAKPNHSIWSLISDPKNSTAERAILDKYQQHIDCLICAQRMINQQSYRRLVHAIWLQLTPENHQVHQPSELLAFLECLGTAEDMQSTQISGVLRQLLAQETIPRANENNQIEIMTIHKSKGLEFDHVFIPGMGKIVPPRLKKILITDRMLDHNNNEQAVMLPTTETFKLPTKLHVYLAKKEQDRNEQELIRLLYVAATRAKKSIFWTGSFNDQKTAPISRSPLALLWPALTTAEQTLTSAHDQNAKTCELKLRFFNHSPSSLDLPSQSESLGSIEDHGIEQTIGQGIHFFMYCLLKSKNNNFKFLLNNTLNFCYEQNFQPKAINLIQKLINEHHQEILHHSKIQWLLHTNAQLWLEQPVYDDHYGKVILDLYLIENETLWIVDFKTTHTIQTNSGQPNFAMHYPQMARYYNVISKKHTNNIKCALFYPLLGIWHEIEPQFVSN